ncbi:MAG: hypothetical protein AAGB93_18575 [Planctomycetota bacterium]
MRATLLLAVTVGTVLGAALPFFFPALGGTSSAGTAVRMSVEEAFGHADLVLEGRVVSGTSARDAGGMIYTDWEIDVERTFWGDERATRIVRLPGGVLANGDGLLLPGLPPLTVGEDVVLLLGETSRTGLRMPIGLGQGKYRIVRHLDGTRTALGAEVGASYVDGSRVRRSMGARRLGYAELVARMEASSQARAAAAARGEGR